MHRCFNFFIPTQIIYFRVITLYLYLYIYNIFEIHHTKYGHEGAHKNEMVIKC